MLLNFPFPRLTEAASTTLSLTVLSSPLHAAKMQAMGNSNIYATEKVSGIQQCLHVVRNQEGELISFFKILLI